MELVIGCSFQMGDAYWAITPRPPILILIFQSSISYSIVAIKTVRRFSVKAIVGTGRLSGVEGLELMWNPDILDRVEISSISSWSASFSKFLRNLKGMRFFFCI